MERECSFGPSKINAQFFKADVSQQQLQQQQQYFPPLTQIDPHYGRVDSANTDYSNTTQQYQITMNIHENDILKRIQEENKESNKLNNNGIDYQNVPIPQSASYFDINSQINSKQHTNYLNSSINCNANLNIGLSTPMIQKEQTISSRPTGIEEGTTQKTSSFSGSGFLAQSVLPIEGGGGSFGRLPLNINSYQQNDQFYQQSGISSFTGNNPENSIPSQNYINTSNNLHNILNINQSFQCSPIPQSSFLTCNSVIPMQQHSDNITASTMLIPQNPINDHNNLPKSSYSCRECSILSQSLELIQNRLTEAAEKETNLQLQIDSLMLVIQSHQPDSSTSDGGVLQTIQKMHQKEVEQLREGIQKRQSQFDSEQQKLYGQISLLEESNKRLLAEKELIVEQRRREEQEQNIEFLKEQRKEQERTNAAMERLETEKQELHREILRIQREYEQKQEEFRITKEGMINEKERILIGQIDQMRIESQIANEQASIRQDNAIELTKRTIESQLRNEYHLEIDRLHCNITQMQTVIHGYQQQLQQLQQQFQQQNTQSEMNMSMQIQILEDQVKYLIEWSVENLADLLVGQLRKGVQSTQSSMSNQSGIHSMRESERIARETSDRLTNRLAGLYNSLISNNMTHGAVVLQDILRQEDMQSNRNINTEDDQNNVSDCYYSYNRQNTHCSERQLHTAPNEQISNENYNVEQQFRLLDSNRKDQDNNNNNSNIKLQQLSSNVQKNIKGHNNEEQVRKQQHTLRLTLIAEPMKINDNNKNKQLKMNKDNNNNSSSTISNRTRNASSHSVIEKTNRNNSNNKRQAPSPLKAHNSNIIKTNNTNNNNSSMKLIQSNTASSTSLSSSSKSPSKQQTNTRFTKFKTALSRMSSNNQL